MCSKSLQIKSAIVALLWFCHGQAVAHVAYGGVSLGYSSSEYRDSNQTSSYSGSPLILQGQIGYFLNDYFAIEGRYGLSTKRSGGTSVDHLGSGLLKFNIPAGERLSIYGLGGWSFVSVDQQDVSWYTENAPSFGMGAHYALSKETAITFEYFNAVRSNRLRLSSINLAYQVRF